VFFAASFDSTHVESTILRSCENDASRCFRQACGSIPSLLRDILSSLETTYLKVSTVQEKTSLVFSYEGRMKGVQV